MRELEVRSGSAAAAPAYSGEIASQLSIQGSLERPVVAGDVKLLRGMITAGGMVPSQSTLSSAPSDNSIPSASADQRQTRAMFATLQDGKRGSGQWLPALEDLVRFLLLSYGIGARHIQRVVN